MSLRRIEVQCGCLHFHADGAHARPLLVHIGAGIVENVGGDDITHLYLRTQIPCGLHRLLQKTVVRDGCNGTRQLELAGIVGIRARAHGDDHILQLHILLESAGAADPDNVVDIIEIEELIGVDSHRGHAHAAAHNGDLLALIGAGIAQHVSDRVEANRILQIVLCDILRAKGIARHQYGFCDISGVGCIMRC